MGCFALASCCLSVNSPSHWTANPKSEIFKMDPPNTSGFGLPDRGGLCCDRSDQMPFLLQFDRQNWAAGSCDSSTCSKGLHLGQILIWLLLYAGIATYLGLSSVLRKFPRDPFSQYSIMKNGSPVTAEHMTTP